MIPLPSLITALRASGTPFRFVGGAIDLVTAGDQVKQFPAAYVLPLADGAGANTLASGNAVSQQLSERFGVMYAVRNVKPGAGADAQEDLRNAIEWARTALVGFQIDANRDLVSFEGGDLVNFESEIAIWMDRFMTTKNLRKV